MSAVIISWKYFSGSIAIMLTIQEKHVGSGVGKENLAYWVNNLHGMNLPRSLWQLSNSALMGNMGGEYYVLSCKLCLGNWFLSIQQF